MCSCHSIPECCVMFSGVKLSMGSFVLFLSQASIFISISRANCTLRNTCGIKKMRNIWTLRNNLILGNTTISRKNNSIFRNTAILRNNSILRNNLILGKTRFSGIPGFCGRPDLTEYRPISSFVWSVYSISLKSGVDRKELKR